MIQLPAGAARTTRRLRACAATTGAIAVALAATTATLDVVWLAAERGPGAHKTLIALTGIALVVAALTGTVASSRRFSITATIAVTAELAELAKAQREMIAELGRQRIAERDRDELTARMVAEWQAIPDRLADAEARGYARALAAMREADSIPSRVVRRI